MDGRTDDEQTTNAAAAAASEAADADAADVLLAEAAVPLTHVQVNERAACTSCTCSSSGAGC